MKSMRSLYKKLFHYVPDKRILAYFSMALSAAAVCSYMGAYWFLWQSIVSILVIPVYEKAMYDAIIVVILMILRGILNIASATCSHYLGFRLETNLRKNGLHKLLDASSSFFDHNSSGEIRKIIDDNAAETHKTVAHLIPDNVTAVMTPVLMFVLMFAIDYRLGILLILTTVIGVLQYRKMSGGTEFLSGYSAALQKMSAATVEYVRGMQIIKIFGVTVQYYKTLINSIKEYKQYVYQYNLPDVQRCRQREHEAREQDGGSRPLELATLSVVKISCAEFGEEKHRKDQVNGGKHHVVDDGLDLRGCRGPGAFHRSGHIAGAGSKGRGSHHADQQQGQGQHHTKALAFHFAHRYLQFLLLF